VSSLAIGLVLAVVASAALNSGYVLQHVGSSAAPAIDARRPIATLRGLLRSRTWLWGGAVGMAGWAMHVGALARAPISLVQAFVAGGLGLMAPVAARALGQRLRPIERAGVGGVVVALGLLCVGLENPGTHGHADAAAMVAFLVGASLLAVSLARSSGHWRPHALGLAGGVLYGTADVAIKAITGEASAHGLGAALLSPWFAAAALATLGAFFAFQRGLQTGHAVPVIVLMTASTTVGSVLGGFVVFGDPLGATRGLVALHLFAFALVAAAAAVLAPAVTAPRVVESVGASPRG
jgi:hypothetical protein